MDVTAWIAMASLAAFVLVHVAVASFMSGGVFARLKRLETDQSGANLLAQQVSGLNATVAGFQSQLEHFSETLRDILVEPRPRRRGTET